MPQLMRTSISRIFLQVNPLILEPSAKTVNIMISTSISFGHA